MGAERQGNFMPSDDPRIEALLERIRKDSTITGRDRDDLVDDCKTAQDMPDGSARTQMISSIRWRYGDAERMRLAAAGHQASCPVRAQVIVRPDGTVQYPWPTLEEVKKTCGESNPDGSMLFPQWAPIVGGQRVPWRMLEIVAAGALIVAAIWIYRSDAQERRDAVQALRDAARQHSATKTVSTPDSTLAAIWDTTTGSTP